MTASGIVRLLGDLPVLQTQRTSVGAVVATWPAAYTNFILKSSATVIANDWNTITNTPFITNNLCFVTNTITSGNQFFRLIQSY